MVERFFACCCDVNCFYSVSFIQTLSTLETFVCYVTICYCCLSFIWILGRVLFFGQKLVFWLVGDYFLCLPTFFASRHCNSYENRWNVKYSMWYFRWVWTIFFEKMVLGPYEILIWPTNDWYFSMITRKKFHNHFPISC